MNMLTLGTQTNPLGVAFFWRPPSKKSTKGGLLSVLNQPQTRVPPLKRLQVPSERALSFDEKRQKELIEPRFCKDRSDVSGGFACFGGPFGALV